MPDEPYVAPPDPIYGDPFKPSNRPGWWEGSGSNPLLTWEDIQRMSLAGKEGGGEVAGEFARRIERLLKAKNQKTVMPPPFWIGQESILEGDQPAAPVHPEKQVIARGEILPPPVVDPPVAPAADEGVFPDEVAQGPLPLTKKEQKRADFSEMFGRGLDAAAGKVRPRPKPVVGPPSGADFSIVDRNNPVYRAHLRATKGKYTGVMADMVAQMHTLNHEFGVNENPNPYSIRDVQAMFSTGEITIRAARLAETGAKRLADKELVEDLLFATKAALDSVGLISIAEIKTHPQANAMMASGPLGKREIELLENDIKNRRLDGYYMLWLDPDKPEGAKRLPSDKPKIGGRVRLHYFDLRNQAEEKGLRIQPINDIILGEQIGQRRSK